METTITKEKLAELLKEKLGFSNLICEEIIGVIFAEMLQLSLSSEKLMIKNFGKFQVHNKVKRLGINLQTGIAVEIPPRKVLKFNASRSFKEKVNSYERE